MSEWTWPPEWTEKMNLPKIEPVTITKFIIYMPKVNRYYSSGYHYSMPDLKDARLFDRAQDAKARETMIEERMNKMDSYTGPGKNAVVLAVELTYEVKQ